MNFEKSFHKSNQYKVSIIITTVLLILGLVLQISFGSIPKYWFSFPYNFYSGFVFIALTTAIFFFYKQKEVVNLFSSVPFAVVVVILMGILTIGLGSINIEPKTPETPQMIAENTPHKHNEFLEKIGFGNITSTWYFAFIFFCVLINLWFAVLKRALVFQMKNLAFLLNHFGLWLILFAGILGQGDIQKLKMTLEQDVPEWRAVDENGKMIELPIALELKKFKMDIYPNKLFLINEKGEALPKNKPDGFLLEKKGVSHIFGKWKVTLLEYIENAVMINDREYAKNPIWGSTNAAKISIENIKTGEKKVEWISCGNFQFPPKVVPLEKKFILVMAPPEAKKFESELLVFQKDDSSIKKASIFVNQPLKINGWKIYQTSYEEKLGRWSDISIVELVSDPWLPLVYAGIFILMIGTVFFLINNSRA